ncbi:C6 zinc finger domain-containing protein [Coccidioides immitis RS]|uniref:C6 zinc finger domain-containing protein n=1 Tax=Coccidioides immitis (strain RS) TaxID=246410 RepID=A0A0E1RUZ3_COCIM|nr:C6 zinc finger domain-containing protein [Coccidioides immitis RS]EAS27416.1 C6 zinc finger domain-containing protein [Coccidioides immitis RS]
MEVIRTPPAAPLSDVSPQNVSAAAAATSRSPTRIGAAPSKAPGTSTKKGTADGSAGVKPKQSKSRNGCVTCKSKRLKCDETKPICRQCQKRNVTCGGYKKDFKWRPFEESSFANKVSSKGKKVVVPLPRASSLSPTNQVSNTSSSPRSPGSPTWQIRSSDAQNDSPRLHSASPSNPDIVFPSPSDVLPQMPSPHEPALEGQDRILPPSPLEFPLGQSPNSRDDHLSDTHTIHTPNASFDGQQYGSFFPPYMNGEDGEIEEVVRQTDLWGDPVSPSMISRTLYNLTMPVEPKFSSGSSEMLLMRFDRRTCGILSVKDGISENPWRTLVWPLAKESPALYHAICSLAAFHCSKEDPQLKVYGMDHMRESVRALAMNIRTMRTDAALATTLALAFAESWDRHISNGVQHLRGAKVLVTQAMENQRQLSARRSDFARLRFLYNTWVYTAVLARLTSLEETGFDDFPLLPEPLPHTRVHEIDPLLGCAATLFPLIGQVANLVRKVCSTKTNSIAIISQAIELKTLIEQWEPPKYFEPPEDPTSDVQHSYQTAQAYRWATLLHLHLAVPEIPSEPASELAKRVLVLLATVPLSSRAIVVQIFPLLAASCEVDNEEDRTWVRERWAAMQNRLMIGNIDRCLEVIHAVWSRRDEYNLTKLRGQQVSYVIPLDPTRRGNIQQGSAIDDDYPEALDLFDDQGRRQSVPDISNLSFGSPILSSPIPVPVRKGSMHMPLEGLEFEKTVRGKLHWLGVMRDWNWEVLLG